MRTIEIPSDVYDALKIPEEDRQEVLQRELALALYEEGVLSVGNARELAGLSRREFHRLLGEREISRHYTGEELAEDIEYAEG